MASDACNTFAIVFIACEFGQRIANAFSEINDLIEQFQWYRFPLQMQRTLPMVLNIGQEPVSLKCFGSLTCCRESLKKVCKMRSSALA